MFIDLSPERTGCPLASHTLAEFEPLVCRNFKMPVRDGGPGFSAKDCREFAAHAASRRYPPALLPEKITMGRFLLPPFEMRNRKGKWNKRVFTTQTSGRWCSLYIGEVPRFFFERRDNGHNGRNHVIMGEWL